MTAQSLFRQRSFAALWWGQLFSITGDRFTYLALAGLFYEQSQRDPTTSYAALLALFANVVVAPVLLFAPFTGAWVDRRNLQRVLIGCDILRALLVLAMPFAYQATHSVTIVFALVFALFAVNVMFMPAKSAMIPEIVPPERLLAANSLLAGAGIIATGIGALLGGYVIDHFGWGVAMQLDAASYLISVVALTAVVYRAAEHHASLPAVTLRGYVREVTDGWLLVRRSRAVGVGLLALAAVWFAGGMLHVAGNQHIQTAASIPGMERLGALLFAIGIGSGAGAWWINTRGKRLPRGRVLGVGLILAGAALIPFALSSLFAVFVVVGVLVGLFAAPALVLTETVLQEGTALEHRARVFSARDFVMRSTLLVSVAFAAWLVERIGTEGAILVTAAALFGIGSVVLAVGRRLASGGRSE
jgi:MFS family permease